MLLLERVRGERRYRWLIGKCGYIQRTEGNTAFSVALWESRQPQPKLSLVGWLIGEKRGLCIQFEQSRGSEGGWSPVAFKFSSILFLVKVPGLESGTVCVGVGGT